MITKGKWLGLLVLLALCVSCNSSSQSAEQASPATVPMLTLQSPSGASGVLVGRLRLVGSEPLTQYVVTDAGGTDWLIDRKDAVLFAGMEQQQVRVRAIVYLRDLILADGRFLGTQRELIAITEVSLLEGGTPLRR